MTDREKIEVLVDEELKAANENYPLFRSPHEAYAVMFEEVQEMIESASNVKTQVLEMWSEVREDRNIEEEAERINRYAVEVVQEAIQVAAMAKKVLMSELYK